MAKRKSHSDDLKTKADEIKKSLTPRVSDEIKKILNTKEIYMLRSLRDCESPIEQLFFLHLMDTFEYHESKFRAIDSEVTLGVFCQKEVEYRGKKYRPDFIIECYALGKECDFVIECDGHDFHEKTKEQAKKDKSRERDLQKLGYRVIRFTGSEIWEDPLKCVFQTFDIIEKTTGLFEKYMTEHFSE